MAEKRGRGRPTKYKAEFCDQAAKLCALGATDIQLAEFFDVCEDTIHEWKKVHSEFSESLKEAKENLDAKVERSLFERAIGYSCKDTKFATHEGMITDEREYIKHFPPDVTAAIFWLKNRQPGKWRDKTEHDHTHEVGRRTLDSIKKARAQRNG